MTRNTFEPKGEARVFDRTAFDNAMYDYGDLTDLEKPLMIVSEGKTTLGYETCVMLAERANLHVELGMLRCEDGLMHEHAFISMRSDRSTGEPHNLAREALDLVFQHKETDDFTRPNFQYMMGLKLGYHLSEILDFIASKVARECPCDLCGGPFVSEEITG